MDDALKFKLDEARERFQNERMTLRKQAMSDEESERRTRAVEQAEQAFWQSLGEAGQEQVRERLKELQPKILPTHPRQLGSTAPAEVEMGVMDEYFFLRRLAEGH